jgi:hypothetical protein
MTRRIYSQVGRHRPRARRFTAAVVFFEKLKRVTVFNAYMEKNPNASSTTAWKELKKQDYPGGVKHTTKELRD